jgi:hypothetical protein
MDNRNFLIENLKSELLQMINKIETSNDYLPIELGLPKLLLTIANELGSHTPNKKKIEQEGYGIFRLVTESYEFEKSELGQELLNLRMKIKEVASTLA